MAPTQFSLNVFGQCVRACVHVPVVCLSHYDVTDRRIICENEALVVTWTKRESYLILAAVLLFILTRYARQVTSHTDSGRLPTSLFPGLLLLLLPAAVFAAAAAAAAALSSSVVVRGAERRFSTHSLACKTW